ncbi:MAG: ABC transporter permease [Phycisphaerales bacterium]|nr:ABC transporter permease [Phycisphaerales bacterium]
MAMTDLSIVRRSLLSGGRWFATATTVLTVGIAVGLLLVLLSLRSAGEQAFSRGTGNMHLLVSRDTSPLNSVLNAVFYMGVPARAEEVGRFDPLRRDPRVAWAVPVLQGDSFKGHPTLATTPEFFTSFQPAPEGPWRFAQGGLPGGTFDVVLGGRAAAETGLRVGDTLHITHGTPGRGGGERGHEHEEFTFEVVGVLEPTATAHDNAVFTTLESAWLIHAHERRGKGGDGEEPTVANLRPDEKLVTGLYVRVRGRGDTAATLPQLYEELRKDGTITVAQPGQQVTGLFKVVSGIDRIVFALAAAVLVSSAVTVMLVLYQAMELRRRQVAVLRVLGASRGRVFMLVLTEAAVIGVAASVLGCVLALTGSQGVAAAVRGRFGLTVTPSLDARWVVSVAAGTVLLACLAGVVSAAAAYRTDVLRHLRPIG